MTRKHQFLSMVSTMACAAPLCAVMVPGVAAGQSAPLPPPVYNTVDQNGVELATGRIVVPLASASIGSGGPGSLSYQFSTDPFASQGDIGGYVSGVYSTGNTISVYVNGSTTTFKQNGALGSASYSQNQGNASSLSYDAGSSTFKFTSRSGEVDVFAKGFETSANSPYWLQSRVLPNGIITRFYYFDSLETLSGQSVHLTRLRNITSSLGYQVRVSYTMVTGTALATQAIAFNMANENCAPTASSCSLANSWPTASFDPSNSTYTDATGIRTRITSDGSSYITINAPSGNSRTYGGGYVTRNSRNYFVVSSYGDGKGSWRYQNPSPYSTTTLVYEPGSTAPKQYVFNASGSPSTISDSSNGATSPASAWAYNALNQVSSYTLSNGIGGSTKRVTTYNYDGRGNLTQETITASDGSGAVIGRSAHYPATCDNVKICNQPDYTIDAKNQRTDYTYEPNSGQIAVVTLPAPAANGTRPQQRYTYAAQSAQFFNGTGTLMSGEAVYLPVQMSQCRSTSNCTGTADEIRTSITYDSASALNAISVSSGDGGGSAPVSATIARRFDAMGNLKSIDGPLPGSADSSRSYYDSGRRKIGEIGPDPDGGGPLKYRAVRLTYSSDGQLAQTELGTATGQGDSDMTTFIPLQSFSNSYDAQGRLAVTRLSAGGTTYAISQKSYDNIGVIQCDAQRMNPATFASLPASACSLGDIGANGPDRIVQYAHDNLFRLTTQTAAVGTAGPETMLSRAYATLGEVASDTDGIGNQTVYANDGFGRRTTTTFSGGSYEQSGYDSNGNVTSRRLRDGQTLAYDFDALNRRVFDHNPKTNVAEVDVSYSYDLLGRLTSAGDGNGWTKNFGYDALGRATTQSSNVASTMLQYDAAGSKTRQTWADGFYVTYEYNVAGQMTVIRENGGLALATFAYDDLGRRTSLTRGNGTVTSYGYDGASRLTSLTQDLAGSAWDQTYGFTYNAAGQILTRSSSNDSYAWTGAANVDRSYAVNALNQYTSAGSTTFGYDARGNLTNSGGTTYQYNSRNQLFMNAAGQLIYRNPAGELGQTPAGNFDWVDGQLAQESTSGVLRRYVYGPNPDEVLVWYEGAGTGDRRYLHADERGSVVAISNDAGNAIAINSYDEYGIPGANNQGRFQYTGQAWLPELGMYDYKARMYSPTLGRFMQTDPIGYADGMNWYNYVGSDPINGTDPTGTVNCKGKPGCPDTTTPLVQEGPPIYGRRQGEQPFEFSSIPAGIFYESQIVVADAADIVVNGTRIVANGARIAVRGTKIISNAGSMLLQDVHDLLISQACCFTAGTLVSTPSGSVAIENLKVGDLVMSRSDKTGETAGKPIVGITPAHERRIWSVTVSYKGQDERWAEERYETTDDHPWRTADGHWVTSASLKEGQELAREAGIGVVAAVADAGTTKLTYNLEVADFHTYFVGRAGTWVHNDCDNPAFTAMKLGYSLDKSVGRQRGQPVYRSGRQYISRDVDQHNGGYWKSFSMRGGVLVRTGTWDQNLETMIGK